MLLELPVIRVQVQRDRIKPGVAPNRRYEPIVLQPVAELRVGPDGAVGADDDGTEFLDVHHRAHPRTRDAKGRSGLSIMTTGDYAALRRRYGPHLVDGIAGESILLDFEPGLAHRTLPDAVTVRRAGPAGATLRLVGVHIAKPCVEFTRFCLQRQPVPTVDDDVRAGLVDLGDGARGYKMVAAGTGVIRPGDVLVIDG